MRVTPLLLAAALGVSAMPSGHQHHRGLHKKDGTVVVATIYGKVVSWTMGDSPFVAAGKPTTSTTSTTSATTTVVAPATTSTSAATTSTAAVVHAAAAAVTSETTSSAAAASTTAASSASGTSGGSGLSEYSAFASCSSDKKRATDAEIAYTGNTGCDGYGSNIVLIQDSLASEYSYVVKVVSSFTATAECKIWNKIGEDGGIDGFFSGNEAKTFTLGAGEHQYVAFDSNSQGGMCCASGSISLTSYGEFNCPWLEFDFADSANDGWSGFDASALVEASTSGPYAALDVCTEDGSVCSSLDDAGSGTNAYLGGDEAEDGIGGNLAAGDVSLIATWS